MTSTPAGPYETVAWSLLFNAEDTTRDPYGAWPRMLGVPCDEDWGAPHWTPPNPQVSVRRARRAASRAANRR